MIFVVIIFSPSSSNKIIIHFLFNSKFVFSVMDEPNIEFAGYQALLRGQILYIQKKMPDILRKPQKSSFLVARGGKALVAGPLKNTCISRQILNFDICPDNRPGRKSDQFLSYSTLGKF